MITFNLANHSQKPNVKVIEIFDDDRLLGVIYPDDMDKCGIKLVSKYLTDEGKVKYCRDSHVDPPVPVVFITFESTALN